MGVIFETLMFVELFSGLRTENVFSARLSFHWGALTPRIALRPPVEYTTLHPWRLTAGSKKITAHPQNTPQVISQANYERNPFIACW